MAELGPLDHLHAYCLGSEPPFRRRSGHISLRQQARVFALSQAGPAMITVHQRDVEDAWLDPATAWLIVSEAGLPPWLGYVDHVREDGPDSISITLLDPIAAVLADTRSPKRLELTGSVGGAVRRMLAEVEAYQPTGISLGTVAEGSEVVETLSVMDVASGLAALLEVAPTYDYWLNVVGGMTLEVQLNWGEPGADRTNRELSEGHQIVGRPVLIRRRAGLVRSVLYVSPGAGIADGRGVEVMAGAGDVGVGDFPIYPTRDPWPGPLPPSGSPAGKRQDVRVIADRIAEGQLAQRAEAVLRRQLTLGLELELTLDLASEAVQSLWLGDTVRVSCPSLRAGDGFTGTVRLRGLEPHEERGQMDAIVSVVSETPA